MTLFIREQSRVRLASAELATYSRPLSSSIYEHLRARLILILCISSPSLPSLYRNTRNSLIPVDTRQTEIRSKMTTKRPHSTSTSTSRTPSPSHEPSAKLQRAPTRSSREVLCTLPPTCNHTHTRLADALELEKHYATYHAHVCEEQGCACVFPEARLLELVCLFSSPFPCRKAERLCIAPDRVPRPDCGAEEGAR